MASSSGAGLGETGEAAKKSRKFTGRCVDDR
jgi:hypothetical protein